MTSRKGLYRHRLQLSEAISPKVKLHQQGELKYVYSSASTILALLVNLLSWSKHEIGLMPIEDEDSKQKPGYLPGFILEACYFSLRTPL